MEAKASVKMIRISSRKVKLVIDLIRGKNVGEAFAILQLTPKAASPVVFKLLQSAVANAEHNYDMDVEKLFVKYIEVGEGPTLKRFRPRAQGRGMAIMKRTSHIKLAVAEKE